MSTPRDLPPVDALAALLDAPRAVAVAAARAVLAERRAELLGGAGEEADLAARARARRRRRAAAAAPGAQRDRRDRAHEPRPRAAGGRGARGGRARAAEGYSNLELDLAAGERGSRHDHVEALLRELTGAEAAIAVNNCAGATLLAAAALAGPGREVVVSRGQLVEIGGGFRVPDVIAQAGARLVEVGTTNRTRLADYARAIGERHRRDPARAPVELPPARVRRGGRDRGAVRARRAGDRRRRLRRARRRPRAAAPTSRRCAARSRAGAALVCFSGDKLLGGPQAGLIVGRADAVAAARAAPARPRAAARQARRSPRSRRRCGCTATRSARRREIPVLAMLTADEDDAARARRAAARRRSAARSSRRPPRSAAARCRCSSCPGRPWRVGPAIAGRARRPAARGRPAGRRPDRGRPAAARPAHARRRRGRAGRARRAVARDAPLTLGTAGHIDHGKTALVRALTGVDTDRLPEERERGISIELGYAPLTLPSGRRLSVVDVPGHERFVRTMVAGRDRDRPVPDGRRRRRRRDAADARARGGARGARRRRRRRGGHEGRPRRPGARARRGGGAAAGRRGRAPCRRAPARGSTSCAAALDARGRGACRAAPARRRRCGCTSTACSRSAAPARS